MFRSSIFAFIENDCINLQPTQFSQRSPLLAQQTFSKKNQRVSKIDSFSIWYKSELCISSVHHDCFAQENFD